MKKHLLLAALLGASAVQAGALTASFASDAADRVVYANGFDSEADLEGWTYDSEWTLTEKIDVYQADVKPFSTIDPSSKMSAGCIVSYGTSSSSLTSPLIEVPQSAALRFYAAFSEIWGYFGRLEVTVIDGTERTLLLNSFLWSQEEGNEGSSWVPFRYDLSAWAGRSVQIEFSYVDNGGGDNVFVDGLAISVPDTSAESSITVSEGQKVSFTDLSEGAVAWEWTLPGAEPATSTEQNPTVAYPTAGDYDVTLTVSDASGAKATATRKAYVHVRKVAAKAVIGRPEGTYMSPWAMFFVPVGSPVTFRDLSTGSPTSWAWTLPGTDIGSSTEQNPTATYTAEGTYGIKLHAANEAGGSDDEYVDAIQAGGSQYVWNITPQENSAIDVIALGWYGNYAGTNFLGMSRFAEHFEGPAADASISEVQAFFGKTAIVDASKDKDVTVSIALPDADGAPGEVIASASVKASELVDGYNDYSPTTFSFDTPVDIARGRDFFVLVGPFPANEGENYTTDDIALYCSPRVDDPSERETTAWHFLLDEKPDYSGFYDTGKWIKQTDEPCSLAVAPLLTFEKAQGGIADAVADADSGITRRGNVLMADGIIEVFGTDGALVARGTDSVSIESLQPGAYIARCAAGAAKIIR